MKDKLRWFVFNEYTCTYTCTCVLITHALLLLKYNTCTCTLDLQVYSAYFYIIMQPYIQYLYIQYILYTCTWYAINCVIFGVW